MTKRYTKKDINLMYDTVNGIDSIIDSKVEYTAEGGIDFAKLHESDFPKLLRIRLGRALNKYENILYELEDIRDVVEELIDKAEGRM